MLNSTTVELEQLFFVSSNSHYNEKNDNIGKTESTACCSRSFLQTYSWGNAATGEESALLFLAEHSHSSACVHT